MLSKKEALVILQKFFLNCNNIYKCLHIVNYNKISINYYSISKFYTSQKKNNDSYNKSRESIIGAIINKCIPSDYFKYSSRWKNLRNEIYNFTNKLSSNEIKTIECIHRGGRMYHYDFTILINDTEKYNIEFKFNAANISESPQFVSPMKPSNYLSNSYEEFYYENYLPVSLGKDID